MHLPTAFKWCFKWLQALRYLHQSKWTHNDCRYHNVVVANYKIILIDWETGAPFEDEIYFFGSIFFAPNRMLQSDLRVKVNAMDDLESFVYSLCCIIEDGKFPWKPANFSDFDWKQKMKESRSHFLKNHYIEPIQRIFYLVSNGSNYEKVTDEMLELLQECTAVAQ